MTTPAYNLPEVVPVGAPDHDKMHTELHKRANAGLGANTPGTFNNPITSPTAARPAGLTYVVWDTPTDPVNWAPGDFNLQAGS